MVCVRGHLNILLPPTHASLILFSITHFLAQSLKYTFTSKNELEKEGTADRGVAVHCILLKIHIFMHVHMSSFMLLTD